jgi:hypothetical protein
VVSLRRRVDPRADLDVGIEPRRLDRVCRSLVSVPTDLSWLPDIVTYRAIVDICKSEKSKDVPVTGR